MNNISRRTERIAAMQKLYTIDLTQCTIDEAIGMVIEDETGPDADSISFIHGVLLKQEEIDSLISTSLTNYNINRLNIVDRAIIRLATYEMLSGTPANIAINEALEITKEFSDEGNHKAVSFNNKLLDSIKKNIKG